MKRQLASLACGLWVALVLSQATAQEPPPSGPAEIIKRAQQRRTPAPEPPAGAQPQPSGEALPAGHPPVSAGAQPGQGQGEALPAGHPPVSAGAQPGSAEGEALPAGHPPVGAGANEGDEDAAPVGGDPHAGVADAPPMDRRPIASAQASAAVPPGSVRVRVVDSATGQPIAGAQLQLGTMTRDSGRTTQDAKTSASGEHVFDKLPTGDAQAYRANVLYDGAKYSSTPFRLPTDQGYDVLIRRLPTTHDMRALILYVGATSIELKDERLKIVQQARLINIGNNTIVFPEEGQLIKFPPKYKAFQAEEVMTDQHLKEEAGQGMRVTGSVPPGEVTLTWGFDLEHEGEDVDLSLDLPWVTYAYRVLADAAPGMKVEIEGMPPVDLHEENGRRFYVSEVVKRVGETPLRVLRIHVRGIPGPGPMRIIATVLAVFLVIGGVAVARKMPIPAQARKLSTEAFEARKAALVAQAAQLTSERDRGDIGPEYHAEQLAQIEEQLAALLYEQNLKTGAPRSATT